MNIGKIIASNGKGEPICAIIVDVPATGQFVMNLLEIATNDFPDLQLEQIDVVHYKTESTGKTLGIEFLRPQKVIPRDYKSSRALPLRAN